MASATSLNLEHRAPDDALRTSPASDNKICLQRGMATRVDEPGHQNLSPVQLRLFAMLAGGENRRLGYGAS